MTSEENATLKRHEGPVLAVAFSLDGKMVASAGADKIFFDLDNEPDLWSETHKRIHPNKITYAELVQRTTEYASAIKAVQPDAVFQAVPQQVFPGDAQHFLGQVDQALRADAVRAQVQLDQPRQVRRPPQGEGARVAGAVAARDQRVGRGQ